jgi:hypothetical protein
MIIACLFFFFFSVGFDHPRSLLENLWNLWECRVARGVGVPFIAAHWIHVLIDRDVVALAPHPIVLISLVA